MAMYEMTVTGEWGASDGHLLLGQAAMGTARDLLVAPFAAPDTPLAPRPMGRPDATLAGVLAVEGRYLDAEDCPPRGFRRLPD